MYTRQTLFRLIIACALFIPIFYHSVRADTFIEVFEFLLAMAGIRSIAFFFFPENKENK